MEQEFPSLPEQGKNILGSAARVAGHFARTGKIGVPEEILNYRMDICKACEKYNEEKQKCRKCGCYLPFKTTIAADRCPLDKWGPYKKPN